MSTPAAPAAGRQAQWLLGVATVSLFLFYYFLRTDAVGVFSPERGWREVVPALLPWPAHYALAALVLGVLPVLAAVRITGLSLGELGLGLGDWRSGLKWLAIGIPLALVAGKIGSAAAPMRAVYPLDPGQTADFGRFLPYAAVQFLYYGAWEVLFRGVLLFGLRGPLGAGTANVAQTGLSVTAHFGRAANETFAALPAGLVFGWLTLRLRSVWYIALLHWLVGVSNDWFILTSS